jgi:hypothetical protein
MARLFFIFFIFISTNSFASNGLDNAFDAGIRFLQEKKYADASLQFKNEYQAGKEFAALFYNWGLAEYLQQRKGLAVGLWRRAIYQDVDLIAAHQALDFIKSELPTSTAGGESSLFSTAANILAMKIGLNKILFICWLFFVFSAYLLLRYWGQRNTALRTEQPLPQLPYLGFCFSVAFLISLCAATIKIVSIYEIHATVIAQNVSLHTAPSESSNAIFEIVEGLDVQVKNVQNSWALVTMNSGVSGWVPTTSLFQHSGKTSLW